MTGVSPRPNEGLDCDLQSESTCGAGTNLPVTLTFDRWLLPQSATRQAFSLTTGTSPLWYFNSPKYDLLSRTVAYRTRGGFTPGLTYTVTFANPSTDENGLGFLAYDGAVLDTRTVPRPYVFRTRQPVAWEEPDRAVVSCSDVLHAFRLAGCSTKACHGETLPAVGLGLAKGSELRSMVGRVARSSDRGVESGNVTPSSDRFGIGMAIVEAGEPQSSLLSYRLLLGADAYRNADGAFAVAPPPEEERERARAWFGVMGPMPPSAVGWPPGLSPIDTVRTILNWIEDGADASDCE
jgi:hypothetical protein